MISVVIPLYNKENQITETLRSVLQQTFQNFEIVIVNDGSTDGSVAAAELVQDARIRIIHQENAGVSAARNKGVAEAKYDLIAFLDADDRWKPEYLQTQYELTQKYPDCSVFACNYEFVHADGTVHPSIIRKLPFEGQDGVLSNYFEVASCSHPPICSISIMVRKAAMQAIGGFPVGIKSGEDLLTWARLASRNKIAYSTRTLALYQYDEREFTQSPREHDSDDPVGKNLQLLMMGFPQPGLRSYISLWYTMMASTYFRLPQRRKLIKNAVLAMKYRGYVMKNLFFLFFALLPLPYRVSLFLRLHNVRHKILKVSKYKKHFNEKTN